MLLDERSLRESDGSTRTRPSSQKEIRHLSTSSQISTSTQRNKTVITNIQTFIDHPADHHQVTSKVNRSKTFLFQTALIGGLTMSHSRKTILYLLILVLFSSINSTLSAEVHGSVDRSSERMAPYDSDQDEFTIEYVNVQQPSGLDVNIQLDHRLVTLEYTYQHLLFYVVVVGFFVF